ncbi:hypothetical protein QQF64_029330 [Cirrhinus molitorella]|uniref:Uncharacterized protein n=1 Tax=Cirrhinus molitorella TaxID=172907 RepID=A0ABR3N935_9TELE
MRGERFPSLCSDTEASGGQMFGVRHRDKAPSRCPRSRALWVPHPVRWHCARPPARFHHVCRGCRGYDIPDDTEHFL